MKQRLLLIVGLVAIGIVVVLGAGWLWWAKVYQQPRHVFSDMLRNSLATTGVTRTVSNKGGGVSLDQYVQLSFGSRPLAHALTVFSGSNGSLTTEEISVPDADYVRYQSIDTPSIPKAKLAKIVGPWAKLTGDNSLGSTLTPELFGQSLLGVIPLGDLAPSQRDSLLKDINESEIYTVDYKSVKRANLNGRSVFEFPVAVHPAAYAGIMQEYGRLSGVTLLKGIDPSVYAGTNVISARISVDARSHNLVAIDISSTGQHESYSAFGLQSQVKLPHATLTTKQLQAKLLTLGQG